MPSTVKNTSTFIIFRHFLVDFLTLLLLFDFLILLIQFCHLHLLALLHLGLGGRVRMILFINRIVLFLRGSDSLELDRNVDDGMVLLHLEHRDLVQPLAVYCSEHCVIFRQRHPSDSGTSQLN